MLYKKLIVFTFFSLLIGCGTTVYDDTELNVPNKSFLAYKIPSKPGAYKYGDWVYELNIQGIGKKSESRTSRLFYKGMEVVSYKGDIIDTPYGKLGLMRNGWHSESSFGSPLFDDKGNWKLEILKPLSKHIKRSKYSKDMREVIRAQPYDYIYRELKNLSIMHPSDIALDSLKCWINEYVGASNNIDVADKITIKVNHIFKPTEVFKLNRFINAQTLIKLIENNDVGT